MSIKLFLRGVFFVLLVFSILFLFFLIPGNLTGLTGKAVLDVNTRYVPGEILNGTLSLSLKSGELVPIDSVVKIDNLGNSYEYVLSDLVSESVIEGDFFVEGASVSGSGDGYGSIGEKEVYPNVDFQIKVVESSEEVQQEGGSEGSNSSSSEEEIAEPSASESSQSDTSGEESPTDETGEESASESSELSQSDTSGEGSSSDSSSSDSSAGAGDSSGNSGSSESSESQSPAPITGEVISESGSYIVEGSLSAVNDYTFSINEGDSIEVVSSTQDINYVIEDNMVIVSTDYYEVEEGFGEDYIGDEVYELVVDLSSLEIIPEKGEIVVGLSYEDEEITSVSTLLLLDEEIEEEQNAESNESEDSFEGNLSDSNITIGSNLTIDVNLTDANLSLEENVTLNETSINSSIYDLTEPELFMLVGETGTDKVSISKAEVINERLVVRYEIGKYWREQSYDYDGGDMGGQIELDRKKFVKNVAGALANGEDYVNNQVEEYVGSYSLS